MVFKDKEYLSKEVVPLLRSSYSYITHGRQITWSNFIGEWAKWSILYQGCTNSRNWICVCLISPFPLV